jgi:glycosyltransferase involved in cell wall biosynthesis
LSSVSIITASLNAAATIGRLGADLLAQTDADFVWIVADGGSSDGTVQALPEALRTRTVLIEQPDFGLYDALNKGLQRCTSTHYLVVGADDRLAPDAVARFKALAADTGADIVAASVRDTLQGGLALPGRGSPWRRGQHAFISHHSVGTLIRRSLHDSLGPYSRQFPIAADHLFIKTAVQAGARVHAEPGFVAGEFTRGGVSTQRYAHSQFEMTLVQLRTERWKSLQLLLFMARLLRHWRRFTG